MSSVNDLFAKRKKKKKGKAFNASKALSQQAQVSGDTPDASQSGVSTDKDRQVVKAKGKREETLATGQWVDDVENKPRQHATVSLAMKLGELDSAPAALEEHEHVQEEKKQEIQAMFHQSRQQIRAKVDEPKEEEVPAKPVATGWRARMAARELQNGGESSEALKHLDNDKVFPTLGGTGAKVTIKTAAKITNAGAWGTVKDVGVRFSDAPKQNVDRDEYFEGVFMAASTFEGGKPGYRFSTDTEGTGYYWEGPEEVVANAEEPILKATSVEETPVRIEDANTVVRDRPALVASAAAPQPTANISAADAALFTAPTTKAVAATRSGVVKTAKKKKKSDQSQMPAPNSVTGTVIEDDAAAAATSLPASESALPPPPANTARFAGLKKKK